MAELVGRGAFEADLARALGRVLREQYKRVIAALGSQPTSADITPELLADMREALLGVVQPILERVYLAQAEALTRQPVRTKQGGIGVDWALINQRAAQWARTYGIDLVTGVVNTTGRALGEQIEGFFTDQRSIEDLQTSIARLFGPVRAEMIAVTEVTRAAAEGEQAFGRELEGLGLTVMYVWQTARDDMVCPICGPRHNKKRGEGWTDFPPAHPRCRCWVNTVVSND